MKGDTFENHHFGYLFVKFQKLLFLVGNSARTRGNGSWISSAISHEVSRHLVGRLFFLLLTWLHTIFPPKEFPPITTCYNILKYEHSFQKKHKQTSCLRKPTSKKRKSPKHVVSYFEATHRHLNDPRKASAKCCCNYFGVAASISVVFISYKPKNLMNYYRGHYITNPNNALLREIPQNYHTFALFDSPQMGII